MDRLNRDLLAAFKGSHHAIEFNTLNLCMGSTLFQMQSSPMHLDHVSWVTSHEQLGDTVKRLSSRLGLCILLKVGDKALKAETYVVAVKTKPLSTAKRSR